MGRSPCQARIAMSDNCLTAPRRTSRTPKDARRRSLLGGLGEATKSKMRFAVSTFLVERHIVEVQRESVGGSHGFDGLPSLQHKERELMLRPLRRQREVGGEEVAAVAPITNAVATPGRNLGCIPTSTSEPSRTLPAPARPRPRSSRSPNSPGPRPPSLSCPPILQVTNRDPAHSDAPPPPDDIAQNHRS